MESGSARPCACAWKTCDFFPDSSSAADLISIRPQPCRMTAWILKLADRGVWFVEMVAFLCFMDNFFPFSPPITDRPSLGLDTIHDFGGGGYGGGGGGGCPLWVVADFFFLVNCQELNANLEVAKVEIGRLSVCVTKGSKTAIRVEWIPRAAHLDARFKTWSGRDLTPCGHIPASCTLSRCYRSAVGDIFTVLACAYVCAAYRLLCNLTSRRYWYCGFVRAGRNGLQSRASASRRRTGRSQRCMAD